MVYCAIAIVFLVFSTDIIWGGGALNSYLLNKPLQPSADSICIKMAGENLKKKQKLEHSKQLLEKAIKIDPYSNAWLLLGICHIAQNDTDKMIETYQRYLAINPSSEGAYTQLIRVFSREKKYDQADKLLDTGIDQFQKRSKLYKPHVDKDVKQEYNNKALRIYQESLQALGQLTAIKDQIAKQRQTGEINDK